MSAPETAASPATLLDLFERSPYGALTVHGDEATIVRVNRTLADALGHRAGDLLGRSFGTLLTPGSVAYLETHGRPRMFLGGELRDVPIDLVRADGTALTTLMHARFAEDGGTDVVHISVLDATDRRRAEAQLRHRALHDPLTGLPNRAQLEERVLDVIRTAGDTPFAVLLLDLDRFKTINDALGHQAGDEVLRLAADRIVAAAGDDAVVARLGGDEFAVLLHSVPPPDETTRAARRVAAAILAALAEPFTAPDADAEHALGASVGIVLGGRRDAAVELLRDADVAMYQAKADGRGRAVLFDAPMRARAEDRARTVAELRTALREGQLRVHYQPVVAAGSGRITGMEALVRWQHPERGLLAPGAFMGVAEESGLVSDIGRFVLREACARLAAWRAEGVTADDVGIAVNVSARQLADPRFPAEVEATLRATGLDATPHLVGLEITETTLMSDATSAVTLTALAATGVELLLDDFGTGASSLARLKRFPVDTLKVDRAFVSGLGAGDGADDAIVEAIMRLAEALDLRVIAEGVETGDQRDLLRGLGCERLQGYLFSRPVDGDAMRALLGGVSAHHRVS